MKFPWEKSREARDDSLDEEIRAHLAMAISDRLARGESPAEAAAAARREFGNVGHVKEVTRETWGGGGLRRTCAMPHGRWHEPQASLRSPCSRWPSASASTPRCSR